MKKFIYSNMSLLFLLGIFLFTSVEVNAQKKTRTRIKAYYEKQSDNKKNISVELIQGSGRSMSGVANAEIMISALQEDENIPLATIISNADGKANLLVESNYQFPLDSEGYAVLNVAYNGNDSLNSTDKEIKFMDLNVELNFVTKDSTNTISISAFRTNLDGEKINVEGLALNIGVQRLYSILPLEKVETNARGQAKLVFPNDIPGDSLGIVNIIVKLTDDDDYGSLTKAEKVNWGTPVAYSFPSNGRSLFGEQAPMWMIIAVVVILAGAWYHFILAIYKVVKMKSLENKENEELQANI